MKRLNRRNLLRTVLQGGALGAALPLVGGGGDVAEAATTPGDFPLLSTAERDRRWELTRKFLRDNNLSAIMGVGGNTSTNLQGYLANTYRGIVVFPVDGAPIHLGGMWERGRLYDDRRAGFQPWIKDSRAGGIGFDAVGSLGKVVDELGLKGKRVAVIGLESRSFYGGTVSYLEGTRIKQALAGVELVDVATRYARIVAQRSAEELPLVRRSAEIGELAAKALSAECRAGALESDLYAAVSHTLAREGADASKSMLFSTDPETMTWASGYEWFLPSKPPRALRKGDVALGEIFVHHGGMDCQAHFAISIGEPSAELRFLTDVSRRAFDAGVKQIRPGVPFSDVWKAMRSPILEAGCWSWTPLIHTMCPTFLTGELYSGMMEADIDPTLKIPAFLPSEPGDDYILKEGMVFDVEPGAARGRRKALTGASVLVTRNGAEVLTPHGTELHVV